MSTQLRIPWFTSSPTSRFYAVKQSVNHAAQSVYAAARPLVQQPAHFQVLRNHTNKFITPMAAGAGCRDSCAFPGSSASPLPGSTQSSNQSITLIAVGQSVPPACPLPGSTQSSNKSTTPMAAGAERPRVSTQLRIPWFTSPPTSRFCAVKKSVYYAHGGGGGAAQGVYAAAHPLVHQPAHFQVLRSQAIS